MMQSNQVDPLQDLLKDSSKTPSEKIRCFLQFFKTKPCQMGNTCSSADRCFYFHSPTDHRRNPYKLHTFAYLPSQHCSCSEEMCPNVHNLTEKIYHPLIYKTTNCQQYYACKMGFVCVHRHQEDQEMRKKGEFWRFDIKTFKTEQCHIRQMHERDCCLYYHNDGDRRRPNFEEYSHVMCPNRFCPNADKCKFSHNKIEQLYHPSRYKSKFCRAYQSNSSKCGYRQFCSFAHKKSEIVIEIIHLEERDYDFYVGKYKTIWCPFTQNHERGNCPYAHNFQDYRRNPLEFKYKPQRCPYWNFEDQIKSIEESGCEKGLACDKCHGWIEQRYHPQNYRRNRMRKDCEEQIVQKKLQNKEAIQQDGKIKGGFVAVGAPFFKQERQISSCGSKKTKARTGTDKISTDKSNDGSYGEHSTYQTQSMATFEQRIGLPIFGDQDKVWKQNLSDFKSEDQQIKEVRYRSEEKKKKDAQFGITYSKSLKQMLVEIGIQQKLRNKRINEVKIINLDQHDINSFKFLDKRERTFFSRRLNEYVLKRQLKSIQYSRSLTSFFDSRKCSSILQKMRCKKVKQQKLINMKPQQIDELSFLSEEEKRSLPKMLVEYMNEKEFKELNELIITTVSTMSTMD